MGVLSSWERVGIVQLAQCELSGWSNPAAGQLWACGHLAHGSVVGSRVELGHSFKRKLRDVLEYHED